MDKVVVHIKLFIFFQTLKLNYNYKKKNNKRNSIDYYYYCFLFKLLNLIIFYILFEANNIVMRRVEQRERERDIV